MKIVDQVENINPEMSETLRSFFINEPLGIARWFPSVAETFIGERIEYAFLGCYVYIRLFDDVVDQHRDYDITGRLLQADIELLELSQCAEDITRLCQQFVIVEDPEKYSTHQPEFIFLTKEQYKLYMLRHEFLKWGMENTNPKYFDKIKRLWIEGLSGFLLENEYTKQQKPIPHEFQRYRNHRALTVYFEMLSTVLWDKDLGDDAQIERFDEFIDWTVLCDLLNDFMEDQSNGVITIPEKIYNQYGTDYEKAWYEIRREVMSSAIPALRNGFDNTMPFIPKSLFLGYVGVKLFELYFKKFSDI